jgi:hypothetical protein
LVGVGTVLVFTGVSCLAQDTSSGANSENWRRFDPGSATAADQGGSGPADFNGPNPQQFADPGPQQGAAPAPIPSELTLPAGAWVQVRVNEPISSKHNHPGDGFSATLAEPLVVNGLVVARRGQVIAGRVAQSDEGGRVKGLSHLSLELTDLSLVDGQQMPVHTELSRYEAGPSKGRDAAAIVGTTAVGAGIGAIAAGGIGAAAGAGAGAIASTIGVLATHGKETVVLPEDRLTFRLTQPVVISTNQSAQAFRAPTQQDYDQRPQLVRRAGPGPYGYGYAPYGGYPYPYWGYPYYGGFYGPGFYYGPGFGFYGRFGRR